MVGGARLPVTLQTYCPASSAVGLVCGVVKHSKLNADWFACRSVARQQTHSPLIVRHLSDWAQRRAESVAKLPRGGILEGSTRWLINCYVSLIPGPLVGSFLVPLGFCIDVHFGAAASR